MRRHRIRIRIDPCRPKQRRENSIIMQRNTLFLIALLLTGEIYSQRRVEKIPFGDFEHWAVRYIKESAILGGKTKTLYAIAPTDTIRINGAFEYGKKGNPWSVSNAYAKVSGIEKGSGTVLPEYRDAKNGICCRMDSKLEEITALGIIDLKVIVAGTIFTGRTIEPIKTAKDPYQNIDFGIPFSKRPKAMMFDYKAHISSENTVIQAKGLSKPKTIVGHDEAQAYCFLQKRWEDAEGNIFALRVATAYERYIKDQPVWVNNHEVEFHYGDITKETFYKPYMGLFTNYMRAMNSKGKIVPVQEIGWAEEGIEPTHMILSFTSGCYEAFVGRDGNTFWVDNIRLVYE